MSRFIALALFCSSRCSRPFFFKRAAAALAVAVDSASWLSASSCSASVVCSTSARSKLFWTFFSQRAWVSSCLATSTFAFSRSTLAAFTLVTMRGNASVAGGSARRSAGTSEYESWTAIHAAMHLSITIRRCIAACNQRGSMRGSQTVRNSPDWSYI